MYCYHRNPVVTRHHVRCVKCAASFVCFREIKVFTGNRSSLSMGLLLNCHSSVYCVRMSMILGVTCTVDDVDSANRFCERTIQIVDVR
jgi:hypothetical protein